MRNADFVRESITLIEMAMPLKDAKEKVESLGKPLACHLAYAFMLGSNFNTYKHWIKEISNFCAQIDKVVIKGNKKLDRDFFIDAFLYHIDTDNDAEIEVNYAWVKHEGGNLPSIIDLSFTREDYRKFKEFRNECSEELSKMFSDKEDHSKEFFQRYFDDKIKGYGR